jgi:DNA-binding IclR family transcriptional regulator
LELIAEEPERAWTLAELTRATGFHKTTIFRMLAALEKRRYLQRERPSGAYWLGPAAIALGGAPRVRLQRVAHAELQRLTDETGETSLLHIRAGLEAFCIDKVESREPIRVAYEIGRRGPLYAGSSGKVLLAFLEEIERDELLAQLTLERFTDQTITDVDQLKQDLARIRAQGYVVSTGELDAGVHAVGAPVWNHLDQLEGGVTLVGPAVRWQEDVLPAFIKATIAAADRMSSQLGHRWQPRGA